MDMEMRHLRVIHAIAEHGSISKAASSLGLSQPALAGQLQRIERMLGGQLFERAHEGSRPTALGGWILERSGSLLHAFGTLQRDARHYIERGTGKPLVRVGCAPMSLAGYVSNCMYDLVPGVDFTIRTEESMDTLHSFMETGRLELAVLGDYPGYELTPPPGVVYEVPVIEPIFVGLAENHPLAGREEIDLADLADDDWAMPPQAEMGHREHFWDACRKHGFAPKLTFSISPALAYDLIRAGRCVGMFQAIYQPHPGIVVRPLVGTPMLFRYIIAWTRHGPLAEHVVSLISSAIRRYWSEALKVPVYASWLERHGQPLRFP
ncbi:LysR family transcriptional regulator [Streptosporangium saharense]|uniref:LysR family transcriptional regulator n=1 Tax=Streptosporangium saharense TaxID=1706840 RepID=UPI0034177247